MKKKKFILPALLFTALLCAGSTLAYMQTETDPLTNTFKAGEVTTEIEENPEVQGSTIKKDPKVVNLGPNDCIVRMRVTISPKEIADFLSDPQHLAYDSSWAKEHDGFWHYQHILPYVPGDKAASTTTPLFSEIHGLTDENGHIREEFKDLEDFQITLYQESVQAVVWDKDGNQYSAYDENGLYDEAGAQKIWDLYDRGLIDIPGN